MLVLQTDCVSDHLSTSDMPRDGATGNLGILAHWGFWLAQASFAIWAPRKLGDPFLVGRKTDHGVLHVAQGYL